MKKNFPTVLFFLCSANLFAQSTRTVVIEHLTNSACSICAIKNPAFYQTLSNYPQVLHISIHPSSPHANCTFSLQNPVENDQRTMYYNAFGATPVIVINGRVLPGDNPLIHNATIDQELNQTSPVELNVYEQLFSSDSVLVRVVVRTTGITTLPAVKLFAGVAEEPINQTTPNGESVHHDVFQKALTGITGDTFFLPAINDSLIFNFSYKVKSIWNINNLYTYALIQGLDTTEILNGGKSIRVASFPTSIDEFKTNDFSIYPNPVADELTISGLHPQQSQLYTPDGQDLSENNDLKIYNGIGERIYSIRGNFRDYADKDTQLAEGNLFHRVK